MQTPKQIKDALERASQTVRKRPSIGQRTYTSHAHIGPGLTCRVEEKDHAFVIDVPKAMGGSDHGASPAAFLRAAMSSCVAIGIKMWAARLSVAVERVDVWFEMDVDARGQLGVGTGVAPGFDRVGLVIDIESLAAPTAIEQVVETSLKHSPLMHVFAPHGNIETRLTISHAEAA